MSKAQEFRKITDEVINTRRKELEAEMDALWAESLLKLERCAKEGRNYGYIEIPCRFDTKYILALVEKEEFRVERTGCGEYKLCW